MYYKYTLLKDLPEAKAGTAWTFSEPPKEVEREYHSLGETVHVEHNGKRFCLSRDTLMNPEWFKREIDKEYLMEIKCPICGETHGRMYLTKEYKYVWKEDAHANEVSVWFEFACGHGNQKVCVRDFFR